MNVLLTGASGFLGSLFQKALTNEFELFTLGRQSSNKIHCDLSNEVPKLPVEINAVIHAAGKAHLYPRTNEEKQAFHRVNVTGTQHLLSALQQCQLSHVIFISSVSVYGLESGELIDESAPLKGSSPYAKSKIEAEKIIEQFCQQKKIHLLILRLPLIVGPNPLGNLGKMMTAIQHGRYVRIAKGEAKKSAVLASDVAQLINIWLLQSKPTSGIYNLTDGYHPNFYEMEEAIKQKLNVRFIPSIPSWLGNVLGKIGDQLSFFPVNSNTIKKITGTFTFSDAKARKEISWVSNNVLNHIA
jgi:GlcNAc-P-P-Und epimerase